MQIYTRLFEEFPLEPSAPIALSSLYEKSGNIEKAKETLLSAISVNPENKVLRLYAGHFFFKQEEWKETVNILSQFIPKEEPIALFFVAYAYFMLENDKLSKHYFLLYMKSQDQPEFIQDAYMYLSKIYIRMGEYETALEYVKKAEQYFSGEYELHLLYAIIYYHLEMLTHALASIEKAHKLEHDNLQVIEWAGRITLALGEYKKAEKHLRKFIDTAEAASADSYADLGFACFYNKKARDAELYFRTALQIEPKHKQALAGIKKLKTEYVAIGK